jgi:hypothetical protein
VIEGVREGPWESLVKSFLPWERRDRVLALPCGEISSLDL